MKETKLELYVNRNSPLEINLNYEGKEYSIRKDGKGLKICCSKGFRVEMPDVNQSEWLIIE